MSHEKRQYHFDIIQGTDEWHETRKGKFGGTDAALFLVKGKNADEIGAGLASEIYAKIGELFDQDSDSYLSPAMQRGIELEPVARDSYERDQLCEVTEVGYVSYGDYFGCSPDGLVGQDGLIEIKCPMGKEFTRLVLTGQIDAGHLAQMQWNMFVTGRSWCDYVVFHPNFAAGLMVIRIPKDAVTHQVFETKTKIIAAKMALYLDELT